MSYVLRLLAAAIVLVLASCRGVNEPSNELDQGWASHEVGRWESLSQGSRLIPLAWFSALEQPASSEKFADRAFLETFRYEYDPTDPAGLGLPIGFVADVNEPEFLTDTNLHWSSLQQPQEPWLGLTCSACHTQSISYKGKSLTVYGGGTLADYQSFIESLDLALKQTLEDPAKFDRFAASVLGSSKVEDSPQLRTALASIVDGRQKADDLNATTSRYGYGRLDAVGQILNRVALLAGAEHPTLNAPDAPVSYPYLWNVPQQKSLQWNGMAANDVERGTRPPTFDLGAFGRNVGEVVGVFADVSTKRTAFLDGFRSSVRTENLTALEGLLHSLKSPRWPASVFGALDPALKDEGGHLYNNLCVECHALLAHDDLTTTQIETLHPVYVDAPHRADTDVLMACNAFLRTSDSGNLKDLVFMTSDGKPIPEHGANVSEMLHAIAVRVVLGKKYDVGRMEALGFLGIVPEGEPYRPIEYVALLTRLPLVPESVDARVDHCTNAHDDKSLKALVYKARPLNGIWATAPYLHNGSVSSLYEMTLPPEKRRQTFHTGTREFDPVDVGFIAEPGPGNDYEFDTSLLGNSRLGHDYGVSELSEHERRALVEFLKSL